jgi:fatty-acyl-CoA synthase
MESSALPPLTPMSLLARSAAVFADRTAVVDGDLRSTYAQLADRVGRLAGGLRGLGVGPGDRVAVLAPNSHVALEATLGIPQAGAVVVMLNIRLSSHEIAGILQQARPTAMIVDSSLYDLAIAATRTLPDPPTTVMAGEPPAGTAIGYEDLVAGSSVLMHEPDTELAPLAINYTSGTTGTPKGAVYHHRGVFLQALAMAYHAGLTAESVYLWTLPMFHCNGWCFPWAVTAAGATHVCLARPDPERAWSLIGRESVTHCCAAPTVVTSLVHHPTAGPVTRPLRIATGGAPPSPTLLERAAALNIDVLHLYGLTETYGPSTLCEWQPQWAGLPPSDIARLVARQGVPTLVSGQARVVDPHGDDLPADGSAMGDLVIRGHTVMAGYFESADLTREAVPDGWLRTGDLAVRHPDGYVEIRDRSKDVIISGGENIASVEVEHALMSHPAVLEAAVVAAPHEHWGEVPVAYVQLAPGTTTTARALIDHVRDRLARFKAPKEVVFGDLPRTATGKIQKFKLREQASSTLADDAEDA